MPTTEWVLRDDDNQIIDQRATKKYSLNLNGQSVHDIEGAVEDFRSCLKNKTLNLNNFFL